jgi:hypothetical protein
VEWRGPGLPAHYIAVGELHDVGSKGPELRAIEGGVRRELGADRKVVRPEGLAMTDGAEMRYS